jgi:hypothetical protein
VLRRNPPAGAMCDRVISDDEFELAVSQPVASNCSQRPGDCTFSGAPDRATDAGWTVGRWTIARWAVFGGPCLSSSPD